MRSRLLQAVWLLLHCSSAFSLETPYHRSYFYVGGKYVDDGAGGHLFQDQMYVEQLGPVDGPSQSTPIVFIHGQGQTGTNFLNKPDGGVGWASRFVEQGFEVYIVDQTFRGRSPWRAGAGQEEPSAFAAEYVQQRFTAIKDYALWPQAALHTKWPGTGTMGDPVFDAFYSSGMQYINNATYQQAAVQAAGAALLDRIGKPVILMGHSQGGIMPPLIADARPDLTKALVLLEPTGPPFQDTFPAVKTARAWGLADIPLSYNPAVIRPEAELVKQTFAAKDGNHTECILQAESPAPRKLANLADIPILTVTAEASFHAMYDECNVRYLRQAGCSKVDHVELGDVGIHGNGHMFFMETNSDEIQELVHNWLQNITKIG
ncbi:fusarubin cluster-esterase [Apiospora arundinis]